MKINRVKLICGKTSEIMWVKYVFHLKKKEINKYYEYNSYCFYKREFVQSHPRVFKLYDCEAYVHTFSSQLMNSLLRK